MGESFSRMRLGRFGATVVVILALGATASAYMYLSRPPALVDGGPTHAPQRPYALGIQIQHFCGECHAYPPPSTFPKTAWKAEIEQAYDFFARSPKSRSIHALPIADVVRYYENNAPEQLALPELARADTPAPISFHRVPYPPPAEASVPAVSNVNLVHLFDKGKLDLLACDLRAGLVLALRPYAPQPAWQVLGTVANPAHAEVVDLDGDGLKDILVANLGSAEPTDRLCGSVVWLRGTRDGRFTPVTLLEGIGRVADVQAADFRGVGKLDLVVAVFGWRETGEVLYLENQTTDWSHPKFVTHVLDQRHGAIHVPVGDLNGDGRPDFVALISQEHEVVVAYLNEGGGRFRKETIYAAPHPAYGSTGIQLVDMNGDGKVDVLYTNGDSFDPPHILRPYQSVQWLENTGRFPFVHHPIGTLYGVHRAIAADFRGRGRPDVVAVSYLPAELYAERRGQALDAVVYFEQQEPGRFVRHVLETGTCDHATCAVGDIFGTGSLHIVTGNLVKTPGRPAVELWKNEGPTAVTRARSR